MHAFYYYCDYYYVIIIIIGYFSQGYSSPLKFMFAVFDLSLSVILTLA